MVATLVCWGLLRYLWMISPDKHLLLRITLCYLLRWYPLVRWLLSLSTLRLVVARCWIDTSFLLGLFPWDVWILLPLHVEDVGGAPRWKALPFDFRPKLHGSLFFRWDMRQIGVVTGAWITGRSSHVLVLLQTLVHVHNRLLRNIWLVPLYWRHIAQHNLLLF